MYLLVGLFFSKGFNMLVKIFPLPILGVILFIESLALMTLVRDTADDRTDLWIAFMVGGIACSLPYGFIIGLLLGMLCCWLKNRRILQA
jgi:mannitol-specific phosphotransferase system IIBC component